MHMCSNILYIMRMEIRWQLNLMLVRLLWMQNLKGTEMLSWKMGMRLTMISIKNLIKNQVLEVILTHQYINRYGCVMVCTIGGYMYVYEMQKKMMVWTNNSLVYWLNSQHFPSSYQVVLLMMSLLCIPIEESKDLYRNLVSSYGLLRCW